jgi:hypothetical protein
LKISTFKLEPVTRRQHISKVRLQVWNSGMQKSARLGDAGRKRAKGKYPEAVSSEAQIMISS